MTNAISKRNISNVDSTTTKLFHNNNYGAVDSKRLKLTSEPVQVDRYLNSYHPPVPPLGAIPKTAHPLQSFRIDDRIPQVKNNTVLEARGRVTDVSTSFNAADAKTPSAMALALMDATYPPLLCPSCKHIANNRTEADHHYRSSHHGEKNFVCMHPYCQQTYSSKAGLKYHLEHMHAISHIPENASSTSLPPIVHRPALPQPFPAPTTRVKSSNSDHAKPRSTNGATSKSSNQQAPKRERKRPKPNLLPSSEQLLNAAYDPLICPVCRSSFKRKTNVINHLVDSHHGEEPYHCIINGCTHPKAYATREGLVYHIANYHDREASANDSSSR